MEKEKVNQRRERCRFEMFIRWPENAGRNINPFTQRGDAFDIMDPDKMLWFLMQYLTKKWRLMLLVELYDTTYPSNDPRRVVLEMKSTVVSQETNFLDDHWIIFDHSNKKFRHRLHYYASMLENFPFPEWFKKDF